MNRLPNCPACTAQRRGIKSRIAYPHTCGKEQRKIIEKQEIESPEKTLEKIKQRHWNKPREVWDEIYEQNWQSLYVHRRLGKFA